MKTIREMSRNGSHEFSCAYYNTLSKLYEPHTFRELSIVHMRNKPPLGIFADSVIWDWCTRNILLEFATGTYLDKNKTESFKQKSTYEEDNFRLAKLLKKG